MKRGHARKMRTGFIILTIGLLTSQSCSTRTDEIFSAFDELHYIILYENGRDFEILYNGVNSATGTYHLKSDTILLTYAENQFKEFDPNKVLTRKILIDSQAKKVSSLDDKHFCANIDLDKRGIN
jgi:hypothetical protein